MTVANFFWHGSRLSLYERACLASFLRHGFEVRVHSFDRGLELPEGAILVDASALAGIEETLAYTQGGRKANITAFSDIFRYRLLAHEGGWWFDADVFCLADSEAFRKLEDASPGITAAFESESHLNVAVLFASDPGLAGELLALADTKGKVVEWGEIGPWLMTEFFRIRPERIAALPREIFYPIDYYGIMRLFESESRQACREATANSLCVHFWNEIITRQGIPKDLWPCEGSYLDELFLSVGPRGVALNAMPNALPGILQERQKLKLENERLRRRLAAIQSSRTWKLGSFLSGLVKPHFGR